MKISVVIPTVGRPSLRPLLTALAAAPGPDRVEIVVVDDRGRQLAMWDQAVRRLVPSALAGDVRIVPGPGRGPAAARNAGWRAATGEWIAFLDDDVLPAPDWLTWLAKDFDQPSDVAGVQGRVEVPAPADRPATDWERTTAGLASGRWITADMAYRRSVLVDVAGFDERFPRAYREDADLALRVRQQGHRLIVGERRVTHPVRPEDHWISVRTQRGNADDALFRRLHGRQWREKAEIPAGRRTRHAVITAAGVAAVGLALVPRRPARALAGTAALGWAAGTAEFARARIASGPRTRQEVWAMVATSAVIPPLAVLHWVRGWVTHRGSRPWS